MLKFRFRDWWKKELWKLLKVLVVILLLFSVITIILLIWSWKFRYQYVKDFWILIHHSDRFNDKTFFWKYYSDLEELPLDKKFTITRGAYKAWYPDHFRDLEISVISWELASFNYSTFERWWNNFLDSYEPNIIINQSIRDSRYWISCWNNWCFKPILDNNEMPKCWLFRRAPRSYNSLRDEIQEWENPNKCKLILFPHDSSDWNVDGVFFFRAKEGSKVTLYITQPERESDVELFDLWRQQNCK